MIIEIYVLSILYIIGYHIHKFLKIWLSHALQLNKRIKERILYNIIFKILDIIFSNTQLLQLSLIIFISITCFLIFIYIYYRFLLVPISKVWPIGCELYKILAFFPISNIKQLGIFDFFDKIIFSGKFASGIAINIILESTIKYSVPPNIYQQIKDSILKDSKFSLEDICGDTEKQLEQYDKKNTLTHQNMIDRKKSAQIEQCINSQMQNSLVNEDNNLTKNIKNKLFKSICTATYSGL